MNSDLITTAEVAKRLGVNVRTVSKWVRMGYLRPTAKAPGVRGAFLFQPSAIERFAAERGAA